MGQTGFCENLQFAAVFCENLRFPAVFCEHLLFPEPAKSITLKVDSKTNLS